jgi:creatinine amidohydrolase
MKSPHRYEDLLPEDFYAELDRAPIAYFAAGAMEEHGLHNPLGTDFFQGYEMCLRAADVTGGIVFPPVPFAPAGDPALSREQLDSGGHPLFPPSLWVSRECCDLLYTELLTALAGLGFKACLGVGGHWPADQMLQAICLRNGGRVGDMRFWGGGTISLLSDGFLADLFRDDPLANGHGTMWETSMMMAIRPELVDLPRAAGIQENALPSQLKVNSPEVLGYIAASNADLGERTFREAADRLVAIARTLLAEG